FTSARASPWSAAITTGSSPRPKPPPGGGGNRPCATWPGALASAPAAHGRRLDEPSRLVPDLRASRPQRGRVLPPVVGAEQQLATRGQNGAEVGLSAAPVTPVESCQRLGGGKSSSHLSPFGWPHRSGDVGGSHSGQHLTAWRPSQPCSEYAQSGMTAKVMWITALTGGSRVLSPLVPVATSVTLSCVRVFDLIWRSSG